MSPANCYVHPEVGAAGPCGVCGKPICIECTTFERGKDRCPECLRRYYHDSRVSTVVGFSAAIILMIVIAGFVANDVFGKQIHTYWAKHKVERSCDPKLATPYLEDRLKDKDEPEVVRAVDSFTSRCGANPAVLAYRYKAHVAQNDLSAAANDTAELVQRDPNNAEYWSWKGSADQGLGQWQETATSFAKALALNPALPEVSLNLARAYEKLNRPCDALLVDQQYLERHPDQLDAVLPSVDQLERTARCEPSVFHGRALAWYRKGISQFETFASFNKKAPGKVIIDKGAALVVLNASFARQLGLHIPHGTVSVQTSTGKKVGHPVTLESITVQGVTVDKVRAAVLKDDSTGKDVDGILGMSFLSKCKENLDAAHGKLELQAAPK